MIKTMNNILNFFLKVIDEVKMFIANNTSNPFFWIGIILLVLVLYEIIYKSFKKY